MDLACLWQRDYNGEVNETGLSRRLERKETSSNVAINKNRFLKKVNVPLTTLRKTKLKPTLRKYTYKKMLLV